MPEFGTGRVYPIATSIGNNLSVPTLTVTVRSAFFNPNSALPVGYKAPGGRDCWHWAGEALEGVTFEISTHPVAVGGAVDPVADFRGMAGVDGKARIATVAKAVTAGVVTGVEPRGQKRVGLARLPLFWLTPGSWLLRAVPPAGRATHPDRAAGPRTQIPEGDMRLTTYRPLHVLITLDRQLELTAASTCVIEHGRVSLLEQVVMPDAPSGHKRRPVNHGYVTARSADELALDMKPDVVRSLMTDKHARAVSGPPQIVVIHASDSPLIAGGIDVAFAPKEKLEGECLSPHYYLDLDGHAVKLAKDDDRLWHTGQTRFFFDGAYITDVSDRSIAIEVVNEPGLAYPPAQIDGLIELLTRLPKTRRAWYVGHSDVNVEDVDAGDGKVQTVMAGGRLPCPGRLMDWPRLEDAGFGRRTLPKTLEIGDYGGLFCLTADDLAALGRRAPAAIRLQKGDDDARGRWGRFDWRRPEAIALAERKGMKLDGILLELQRDLQIMGYSLELSGRFDVGTRRAVRHFIWHTFSGKRLRGFPFERKPPSTWLWEGPNPEMAWADYHARLASYLHDVEHPKEDPDVMTTSKDPIWVSGVVASYIKGTVRAFLDDALAATTADLLKAASAAQRATPASHDR